MKPLQSGRGFLPRYGGGWKPEFGHVYALQQELLHRPRSDWFRAIELWHTARHEGVAMNVAHFNVILRQCQQVGQWQQSLQVLAQMRREALRPDVHTVGSAVAACANSKQWEQALAVLYHFRDKVKLRLDSNCYLGAAKALNAAGRWPESLALAHEQDEKHIPMLTENLVEYIEAAKAAEEDELVMVFARRLPEGSTHPLRTLDALRDAD